jgi:hypothetical protein
MSFLYPLFLIGAVAAAIPIVLHLLRRDVAPEVPFSAVRLLRRTPLEQTRRRRLRDLLLLAARVLALLLLAAAFARPYFADAAAGAGVHVVAVDRSFSMGAPGRFARALDLARSAIEGSDRGGRVAVIAFDDGAEVIAPPGSAARARAALDGLQPGFGSTRYQTVIARALELADHGTARVTIVTDLQRAGWEEQEPMSVPAGLAIETVDTGAAAGNAAVTSVRRTTQGVVVSVRNDRPEPLAGTVRVLLNGRAVASAPFSASAHATLDVPISHRLPDTGNILAEIDDPNGYPADDKRYAILDRLDRQRVLIVGSGGQSGFYLTQALQAAGQDSYDVRSSSASALGRIAAEEVTRSGAVLLASTKGFDRAAHDRLAAFVRAGGGLLVVAGPDVDPSVLASIMGWRDFGAAEQPAASAVLAATDLRHPIFRPFGALAANLGQVHFTRVWRVGGAGWEVAARFTDGTPALLERREGRGRIVLFASDLDRRWNDFPLHPAFVPFALETVRHIVPVSDGRRDFIVADAPPDTRREPGIHARHGGRSIAVNVDVRESGTARLTAEEFRTMTPADARSSPPPAAQLARETEGRQNLWRYGLLLMLGALVAESVVGRGR